MSSNVYAFGCILVDLIKGKESSRKVVPDSMSDEDIMEVLDPKLGDTPLEFVRPLLELAQGCLIREEHKRPKLIHIIDAIESIRNFV
jgi:hypothetical protein